MFDDVGINHQASGDSRRWGISSNDEVVAMQRDNGRLQSQLCEAAFARRNLRRVIENTHSPNPDAIAVFGDSILYVNLEECTSCTACYQPDVCPVGAIYSEDHLPNGSPSSAKYNAEDPNKGHDHTYFVQHSREVFAD